jgi:hypothetical protein
MIWGRYLGESMVRTTNTLHIRTFASYSPAEKILYVYLLNKAEDPVSIDLQISDHFVAGVESYGQLTGQGSDDVDPVWNENVTIAKKDLGDLLLPPVSISVIKIKLK